MFKRGFFNPNNSLSIFPWSANIAQIIFSVLRARLEIENRLLLFSVFLRVRLEIGNRLLLFSVFLRVRVRLEIGNRLLLFSVFLRVRLATLT